jgi:hypothetical protein
MYKRRTFIRRGPDWGRAVTTNSKEQNSFWEANNSSASQDIPCIFMEPEDSLPWSQEHAIFPCPEPEYFSPRLPALLLKDQF